MPTVTSVDAAELLLAITLVLAFAKLGAELAERVGIPAVIGEIAAGLVLGPSLLDWVELDETMRFLAELGVIMLLLQVGMEMDLREMRKVGGTAIGVALVGVAGPMLLGYGAAVAFDHGGNQALFLAAALAATSVGITARAFGDLRILSSTESRIVLGAAVVDDILGLVILTVVVRIVEEGTIDPVGALVLLATALGFLVVATAVTIRIAPPAFRWLQRNAASPGTLVVVALVLTFGVAWLAHEVDMAVIIGAFVAGLALGRTRTAERLERDLTPISSFFVPIFFVSVGLEVDVASLADPGVLGFAAALLVAAVVGKQLVAVVVRKPADGTLVGIGMVPRGEVGLIFAAIGLSNGVLDQELYGALLVVVLVTTVMTPPLIRRRITHSRSRSEEPTTDVAPPGGWLAAEDGSLSLRARPSDVVGLSVALEAARQVAELDPDDRLVTWMGELAQGQPTWDGEARAALADLLASGNRRSWRLLDASGLLASALPDLADELDHRRHDTALLDPAHLLRLPIAERLAELLGPDGDERARAEAALLAEPELLYLAGLALDLAGDHEDAAVAAKDLTDDIGLDRERAAEVGASATDAALLRRAALHFAGAGAAVSPEVVHHVATPERARRIYLLGLALGDLETSHRNALEELYASLVEALGRQVVRLDAASSPLDDRRRALAELVGDPGLRNRVARTPASLLVIEDPDDLAADLGLLAGGTPLPGDYRVSVSPTGSEGHRIAVAGRDEPGLFARVTGVLAAAGCDIERAAAGEYPDGTVLDVFHVRTGAPPTAEALSAAVLDAFRTPLPTRPPDGVTVTLDNLASPWFTVCAYTVNDEPGVLAALGAALQRCGVSIHGARVVTREGLATGRFDLTDPKGRKLSPEQAEQVTTALTG
jgi:Kef-type K+ transport system membrane component KefB/predicted amino acid-binding ACT domain protein